jgi:hypothetical protein
MPSWFDQIKHRNQTVIDYWTDSLKLMEMADKPGGYHRLWRLESWMVWFDLIWMDPYLRKITESINIGSQNPVSQMTSISHFQIFPISSKWTYISTSKYYVSSHIFFASLNSQKSDSDITSAFSAWFTNSSSYFHRPSFSFIQIVSPLNDDYTNSGGFARFVIWSLQPDFSQFQSASLSIFLWI